MLKKLLVVMAFAVFAVGCSNMSFPDVPSFKRTGKEFSDPKWNSFPDVEKSFGYIKENIESGKNVTIADLNYLGFGPETKNVKRVGYLELEKLLVGEQGDRNRLPKRLRVCTDKQENCYGLVVSISSADTEGKESFIKRMLSGEKKTVSRGWRFSGVFAVEKNKREDVVVFAYVREADGNVHKIIEEDDTPGAVIGATRSPASLLLGF